MALGKPTGISPSPVVSSGTHFECEYHYVLSLSWQLKGPTLSIVSDNNSLVKVMAYLYRAQMARKVIQK